MAAQRFPLSARPALLPAARLAVGLGVGLAVAAALAGCADAFTYSRSETSVAMVKLEEGDSEEAAIVFANQVRRWPNNYKAHYHLGLARLDSGRPQEAIRSFKTALEVMPLSKEGREDATYRFYTIDALSGALAEHDADGAQLAQIEAKAKGNPHLQLLVAMTHAKAGRPDNAIESFNAARALDRDDPQIAKQFGLYLESIAQAQPAEHELRRAYRLNTQDEEVAAALRRLGVIPGPAILSATELTKPVVPLGPIPEVKFGKDEAKAQANPPAATPEAGAPPVQGSPAPTGRGLN